jgi:hypothetical protein
MYVAIASHRMGLAARRMEQIGVRIRWRWAYERPFCRVSAYSGVLICFSAGLSLFAVARESQCLMLSSAVHIGCIMNLL